MGLVEQCGRFGVLWEDNSDLRAEDLMSREDASYAPAGFCRYCLGWRGCMLNCYQHLKTRARRSRRESEIVSPQDAANVSYVAALEDSGW